MRIIVSEYGFRIVRNGEVVFSGSLEITPEMVQEMLSNMLRRDVPIEYAADGDDCDETEDM